MDTQLSETYKKKLIKYFLLCILSEGSKIILYSLFFIRINLFVEFLFALFILMFLRTNGGGLHFKHYTTCLIFSFLVFLASVFLGIHVIPNRVVAIFVLIISIPLGHWCVPVTSNNRPDASEKLIKKSKRNTLIVLSAYLISVCILPTNRYYGIIVWIVIIHIVQLLLAKILKRRNT